MNAHNPLGSGIGTGQKPGRNGKPWQEQWTDRFYRNRPHWLDGTTEFKEMCSRMIPEGGQVLDLGAGPENNFTTFLATQGEVTGLDLDERVLSNRACSRSVVYKGTSFPLASESFHVVVGNYVMEHVEFPEKVTAEVYRILRPGGVFVFRTPNLLHPVGAVSALTSDWLRRWLLTTTKPLREGSEFYPTFYRMNTEARCRNILRRAGFDIEEVALIEKEPSYGMRSRALFLLFLGWERAVNRSGTFARFRANLLCAARKTGQQPHAGNVCLRGPGFASKLPGHQ
jgi:2-polyprenyl-3-methyl-5-hydroxy-6-metoxy-1,4-benzoquinol methylase